MGLSLEVGILADLQFADEEGYDFFSKTFERLNEVLLENRLPKHNEPTNCEVWSCQMYGHSGLHYLRRFAAHLDLNGQLPEPGGTDSADDPVLERYFRLAMENHTASGFSSLLRPKAPSRTFDQLIIHSDAEGFYLPADFSNVVFVDDTEIPGGMVGSSVRLLGECKRLAASLRIPEALYEDSRELWEVSDSQGKGTELWPRYGIESFSCVCLMRGCEASIRTGAALVFT